MKKKAILSGLSLFSGAGGMDLGFIRAGINVVCANELNKDACDTYQANHPDIVVKQGDICEFLDDISFFKGIDVVFGGPPCQGFSVAGKMNPDDPRNRLLWKFMNVVEKTKPRAFVCENVKALAKFDKWSSVRMRLFKIAKKLGYSHKLVLLNAADFGVPQSRERMFLIGFRNIHDVSNLEQQFEIRKKKPLTVRDILFPLGLAGSKNNNRVCNAKVTMAAKPVLRRSPYAGMMFNGQGRPLNPNGYSCALHASMGGNKTPIIDEEHCYFNEDSWVESYHSHLMKGGQPLPLDSAPKRLRRLTVDEALRLQTFPNNYKFVGKKSSIYKQIGNAVPCILAEVVADVVKDCLMKEKVSIPVRYSEPKSKQLRLFI